MGTIVNRPRDLPDDASAPTMIIPRGTEIEVDAHGQLSVRAPGNLVIQNSGSYGTIESRTGSIRIDHGVEVEAVSVRCAQDCYVLGSLTAWKVSARALQLEDTARANIVLQETERLDIGRGARLVGNFDSEKELFLLFSRFAREFRSLPFFLDRRRDPDELSRHELVGEDRRIGGGDEGDGDAVGPDRPATADLPEPLFFALVLLDRDAGRGDYGHSSQRVLKELIKLLQEGDLETLELTYRTLLGRVVEPRDDVRRAAELIDDWFTGGGAPD
jgi:hypothetical protein